MSISCKGENIKAKSNVKYLGATFDQDMSCSTMGTSVVKKVNAKIKFMYRKASFFGTRERKLLCSAIIQSNFDYACNAWYRGLNKAVKLRLQTAQNKVIRYILKYGNRHHIAFSDFSNLKWLNVAGRVDYLALNLMYNVFNKTAPSYMCDFQETRSVHNHTTRNSNLTYFVPHVKTQGSKTFKSNGLKLWNNLPYTVKTAETKEFFKKRCKHFLMNKMRNDENSDFVM